PARGLGSAQASAWRSRSSRCWCCRCPRGSRGHGRRAPASQSHWPPSARLSTAIATNPTRHSRDSKEDPRMAAIKRKVTSKSARRTRPRAVKAKPAAKPVAKGPRRKRIDPGWSWDDRYPLAQGIHAGQTIFVSGQLALGPSGEVVGLGDIKAQTHQAFRNIATILEHAGAGL